MTDIKKLLAKAGTTIDRATWKPVFFNLKKEKDAAKLTALLQDNTAISVHDEIENQLGELVKALHPSKKFNPEELKEAINHHVGETPLEHYGNWVYYPWSKRLVHILGEEEYIFARTSRNRYKITPEEQEILANKKIGVIGLSVGQSVSLTLAMERICGEIRLTDFDILELTNLNRIRTGAHTIGLKKVYAVAREISEIDPYLKVVCYPEGLNEENMDSFFNEGGKLDLLIEESDGLDIKITSRFKARELGIPVLMEASDRCMVDVERFDLEPDRPILHGLVKHLNPEMLKTLKTNEEKIPYMLDILGIDTCSTRLKASMLEIEQTITTWPQLASAVIMGGGITADVARRLLLNQFTESGRYWVDAEELIGNKQVEKVSQIQPLSKKREEELHFSAKKAIDTYFEQYNSVTPNIFPNTHQIRNIIEGACLAPSGGNSQPWRWYIKNSTLFLLNPFNSEHTILGAGNRALKVAQGAAIENLEIKASALGYKTEINFQPEQYKNKNVIAEIRFSKQDDSYRFQYLEPAIGIRLTNRANNGRKLIDKSILEEIASCVGDYNSSLTLFTSHEDITSLTDVLGEMEQIRILEKIGHEDFVNEIRWSDKEAEKTKDGIELGSIDLSMSERAGLFVAKDKEVMQLLRDWDLGSAFGKLTRKTVESASAIGVLRLNDWSEESFFYGGRILERIWLKANQLGISFQPTAASVFMLFRLLEKEGQNFSQQTIKKINAILPTYNQVLNRNPNKNCEIFIFRLNIAEKQTKRSIRKPIEEVII